MQNQELDFLYCSPQLHFIYDQCQGHQYNTPIGTGNTEITIFLLDIPQEYNKPGFHNICLFLYQAPTYHLLQGYQTTLLDDLTILVASSTKREIIIMWDRDGW